MTVAVTWVIGGFLPVSDHPSSHQPEEGTDVTKPSVVVDTVTGFVIAGWPTTLLPKPTVDLKISFSPLGMPA